MWKVKFLFGLTALIASNAWGADVAGRVAFPGGRAANEAVISLEGAEKARPMPNAVVDQRKKTFIPHVSVVPRGTTVHFPNNDTVFHNVFAYYQAKKFDLGMYPRGATKNVTFDKAGLVVLLCNVHSEMSAYIMVVDTPYYAVSDARGAFTIPHVPPGKYTLRAWQESGATASYEITVTADQKPLSVSLGRK
jgi:plastocyanin